MTSEAILRFRSPIFRSNLIPSVLPFFLFFSSTFDPFLSEKAIILNVTYLQLLLVHHMTLDGISLDLNIGDQNLKMASDVIQIDDF